MKNSILPLCTMLACTVSVLGCIGTEGDNDDDMESVAFTQQPALTVNALTVNALTVNALTVNALTVNALTVNALTVNALTVNNLTANALKDPNARELLKYVVSCALPSSDHLDLTIDGVDYVFPGQLSLAPKWGLPGGSCNTTCQEWVSACVLARVDYLGKEVNIAVRGAQIGLAPAAGELAAYTYREGAYYGNIFQGTPVRDACVAPGRTGLPRVCGPSLNGCVVDAIGGCSDVCLGSSGYNNFMNCADQPKLNGQFPAGTKFYPTAITVFLLPQP
ncbi:MAG: hypothetical protein ABJE95_30615 [Byssovorax sp.]